MTEGAASPGADAASSALPPQGAGQGAPEASAAPGATAATRRRRSGSSGSGSSASTPPAKRPLALWLLAAVVGAITVWLVPTAWNNLRADLIASPARRAINPHALTNPPLTDVAQWRADLARLNRAAEITPDNAGAHADLAALHMAGLGLAELSDDERGESALGAVLHLQRAVTLRPADPRLWANLARARLLSGDVGPEFEAAWQRAAILGPYEAAVQTGLLELALVCVPDAITPAMAEWVQQLYTQANEGKREGIRRAAVRFDVVVSDEGGLAPKPVEEAASAASN